MVRQFIFHELNQVTDFLKSLSMDYVAVHLADSTGVVGYIQRYYIGSDNILQRAASVGMVCLTRRRKSSVIRLQIHKLLENGPGLFN
jgi:hypothetical protein